MEIWGKWLDYSSLELEVSSLLLGPYPPPSFGLIQSLLFYPIFGDHLNYLLLDHIVFVARPRFNNIVRYERQQLHVHCARVTLVSLSAGGALIGFCKVLMYATSTSRTPSLSTWFVPLLKVSNLSPPIARKSFVATV